MCVSALSRTACLIFLLFILPRVLSLFNNQYLLFPRSSTSRTQQSMIMIGTYKVVPKVEWTTLLANEFGAPAWEKLYPLNDKSLPTGILTPRLACKLFHDSLFIIKKGEENPKYICDRIPEHAHKMFKKKQWRKQFFESMRRVACRLAAGLGFQPNCVAEGK